MSEIDADAAKLALAAIAEVTGEEPLADAYLEDLALRAATFADLDVPTARRVVEIARQAPVLAELLVRVQVAGTGAEVSAAFRQIRRRLQGLG